ncbi:MAG TPA: hypothetical protein VN081_04075 [Dongiaceae bacterium]|nr:hypothetical protein [Dongiaceae bacterium]
MNASTIINDEMTLDEKLAAIDAAMSAAVANAQTQDDTTKGIKIDTDPADMFMCVGCQ